MDTTPIFLLLFNFPTCPKILSSKIFSKKVNNLCVFITRVAFGNLNLDLKLIDLKITLILGVISNPSILNI